MGKEILTFGDIEIEKNKFYRHKTPIFLKDVDIDKVLVSNKISFSEKNYKYLYICILVYTCILINIACIMIIKLDHYI